MLIYFDGTKIISLWNFFTLSPTISINTEIIICYYWHNNAKVKKKNFILIDVTKMLVIVCICYHI